MKDIEIHTRAPLVRSAIPQLIDCLIPLRTTGPIINPEEGHQLWLINGVRSFLILVRRGRTGAPDLSALQPAKFPQCNRIRVLWFSLLVYLSPDIAEKSFDSRYSVARFLSGLNRNMLRVAAGSGD